MDLNEQPPRAAELVGAIPFERPQGDGDPTPVAGVLLSFWCDGHPTVTHQLAIRATDVPRLLEMVGSVMAYWIDPAEAVAALALQNAADRAELRRQGRGDQAR